MKNFFTMLLAFTAFFGSGEAASKEEKLFDPAYSIGIVFASTEVTHYTETYSNYTSNYWKPCTYIKFNNGLVGMSKGSDFSNQTHAYEIKYRTQPFGNVNILETNWRLDFHCVFDLVFDVYPHTLHYCELALDKDYNFEKNPSIISFSVSEQVTKGWIFNGYKYKYVIDLDDGSTWASSDWIDTYLNEEQVKEWSSGKVIIIGNSKSVCMVLAKPNKYSPINNWRSLIKLERIK